MDVFFISGLGADKRMFRNTVLPEGYRIIHVDWIPPLKKEPLPQYCHRLLNTMPVMGPFCMLGLSFGGIVATEIAKICTPEKLLLLSSIRTKKELPDYYRSAGKLHLQDIAPISIVLKSPLAFWLFGVAKQEEKELLRAVFSDTSPEFLHWSLQKILEWENETLLSYSVHVHGDSDRLLPVQYTHADRIVREGGHLMVLNRYEEVNRILHEVFSQNP